MKKSQIIAITAIVALAIFPFGNNIAQDRRAVWIHGLGGDGQSWNNYYMGFSTSHQMTIESVDYFENSTNGIHVSANEVDTEIMTPNNPDNIYIAHSFGGLVGRQLNELDDQRYGGFITAGTPHRGAYFATSYKNGDVEEWLLEGCEEALTEPFSSGLNALSAMGGGWIATLLGILGDLISLADVLFCSGNSPFNAFDIIEGLMGDFVGNGGTINDLAKSNDVIDNLPYPNKPMLTLWGNEESPVHWRWLGSLTMNNPVDMGFGGDANGDEQLVMIMHKLKNWEIGLSSTFATLAVGYGVGGIFNPALWGAVPSQVNASIQFAQGAHWINSSEASWNMLIGAGEGQEYDYACYLVDVNVAYEYDDACWTCPDHHHIDYALNQTETYVTQQEVCLSRPVSGRSDGLVTEESARSWEGCNIEVRGANHQELLNHPESVAVFTSIFDNVANQTDAGNTCNNSDFGFFAIPRR